MLHIKRRQHFSLRLYSTVAFVGLITGGFMFYHATKPTLSSSPASILGDAAQAPSPPKPTLKHVESKMMIVGDVFWGRYINDWSMKSDQKYAYPFQRLSEFDRDSYDAWINDMECPITNNPKVSSREEDTTLSFDCSPAYLEEAKKWFTVMTLANNHTDNQGGEKGLVETRQHLESSGIQYFGTFDPEDYENVCDVIAMPARIMMSDSTIKKASLPMTWCGYHGVFKTPTEASINLIRRYARVMPVVAMPHSGAEYKAEPDTIKTAFYRSLVDAGADVVIGDHPHWVQSSEAYKGHLIMYSLGNFIFDQQFNTEVTRSAVLSMTVSLKATDNPDIEKWMELGEVCKTYHDTCLEQAEKQALKKLSVQYHFSVAGSDNSSKLVKKSTPEQLMAIKNRLRWDSTVKGLAGQSSAE